MMRSLPIIFGTLLLAACGEAPPEAKTSAAARWMAVSQETLANRPTTTKPSRAAQAVQTRAATSQGTYGMRGFSGAVGSVGDATVRLTVLRRGSRGVRMMRPSSPAVASQSWGHAPAW